MRPSLALLLICGVCLTKSTAFAQQTFDVTIMRVIDGDTMVINEQCSRFDNKTLLRVRVFGIDTPESHKPPAKCDREIERGREATRFARELIKPGTQVQLTYRARDKYACRTVGSITLPDGRDFADVMIQAGYARPYGLGTASDRLTKSDWCN